jgi:DnaK suppressor protein
MTKMTRKKLLTARQLADIKARIETRVDRLRSRIGGTLVDQEIDFRDPVVLEQLEEFRLLSHLAERDARLLADLGRALVRIDRGEFGACVACAEAIPYERLDLVPEIERCVSCA